MLYEVITPPDLHRPRHRRPLRCDLGQTRRECFRRCRQLTICRIVGLLENARCCVIGHHDPVATGHQRVVPRFLWQQPRVVIEVALNLARLFGIHERFPATFPDLVDRRRLALASFV